MELEKAKLIASSIPICDWCLGRQFTRNTAEAEQIGRKIRERPFDGECTLCNNTYLKRREIAENAAALLSRYEFSTLTVGTIIPSNKVNMEDEIRSKFKLHSGVAIKRALVQLFRKEIGILLKKETVARNGEVLLIIDLAYQTFHVESRSIGLLVRYVKLQRSIKTRGIECVTCQGSGCSQCEFTGISKEVPSIEFEVVKHFKSAYAASKIKITWSGTEDDDSLVLGKGRPIFLQIINPMLRKNGFDRTSLYVDKKIQFTEIMVTNSKPPSFEGLRKVILYRLKLKDNLAYDQIKSLEEYFTDRKITMHPDKERRVYYLSIKQNLDGSVIIMAEMDNGLSPWRVLGLKQEYDAFTIVKAVSRENVLDANYDIIDFKP